MTFDAFDVFVAPFPFRTVQPQNTDPLWYCPMPRACNKRIEQSVPAMITNAKHSTWPLDVEIEDLNSAGLPSASVVRMKLFTLDHQLMIRKAGALAQNDCRYVIAALQQLFDLKV